MTSVFATLTQQQEESGRQWQTTAIRNCGPDAPRRLAVIAAVIQHHFLDDLWKQRVNRGSITFQHKDHNHLVVTIFIDKDNRLAQSYGFSLQADPAVIAIELTALPPYARAAIRNDLKSLSPFYIEPKTGNDKLRLQPQQNHHYDVLFLPPGPCAYETAEDVISQLEGDILNRLLQDIDLQLDDPNYLDAFSMS